MLFGLVGKKETTRNPYIVKGRQRTQCKYAHVTGSYPDFYGWRYNWYIFYYIVVSGLYAYFVGAYIVTFIIGIMYDDREVVLQVAVFGTLTIMYWFVTYNQIFKKPLFDEVMEMIGRGLSNYSRPFTAEEAALEKAIDDDVRKHGLKSSAVIGVMSVVHMGILPLAKVANGDLSSVTNQTAPINVNTPLPIYMPWDTSDLKGYLCGYFFQFCSGSVECSLINSIAIMFVGLSSQLSGNFKLLMMSLRDIHNRAVYMLQDKFPSNEVQTNDRAALYKNQQFLICLSACFKENVQHHIVLLEFHKKVQNIVGFSILALFMGNALIISISAFSVFRLFKDRNDGDDIILFIMQIISWLLQCITYLFLLSVYCFHGQKVTDQSTELLRAFNDTPWIEGDHRFRSSVTIAMTFGQKYLQLDAMGFAAAGYESLLTIVQTSFSYLNMLVAAS